MPLLLPPAPVEIERLHNYIESLMPHELARLREHSAPILAFAAWLAETMKAIGGDI